MSLNNLLSLLPVSKTNNSELTEGYLLSEIESYFDKKINILPKTYVDFLIKIGKESFCLNYYYSLNKLELFRDSAERLTKNNIPQLHLDHNDFIFIMNEGYIFAYFKLNEGDDPAVYGFAEGVNQQNFEKLTASLSEFFERILKTDEDLFDNLFKSSDWPSHVYKRQQKNP